MKNNTQAYIVIYKANRYKLVYKLWLKYWLKVHIIEGQIDHVEIYDVAYTYIRGFEKDRCEK